MEVAQEPMILRELGDQLEKLVECGICKEELTDPRSLPCVHTFCLKCLQNPTMVPRSNDDELTCPTCQKKFVVASNEELPRNHFVEKLKDMKKSVCAGGDAGMQLLCVCQQCFKLGDGTDRNIPTAAKYCKECLEYLCVECGKEHGIKHQGHELIKVDYMRKYLGISFAARPCERHPTEAVRMHCHDCSIPVCSACVAEGHSKHNIQLIQSVGSGQERSLKERMDKIQKMTQKSQEQLELCSRSKNALLEHVYKVREAVIERSEAVRQMLEEDTDALLGKLKCVWQDNASAIDASEDEIDEHLKKLYSILETAQNIPTSLTDGESFLRYVDEFCSRSDEVEAENVAVDQRHEQITSAAMAPDGFVAFVPSDFESKLRMLPNPGEDQYNVVGVLKEQI